MNKISYRIKKELYFVRKMFQYRYGPIKWYRYITNKFFSLQLLHQMKPISYQLKDDFEIHILVPRDGLWMAYWTIRSFLYHSGLCPRVILHDDGTIDEKTARMFESKFADSPVHILSRREADWQFATHPDIPPLVKQFRDKCKNIFLLMFVDHLFLSASRRVFVLDNDILFYDTPTEIIDFMAGKSDVYAMYAVYAGERNPVDVDDEYKTKYADIVDHASGLNSGTMIFDKSKIDFERVTEYFQHTTKPDGHLIEQTGWGFTLSQIPHIFFPESRYKVRGGIEPPTVSKHFTTPRRHEMFAYGIDAVRKRMKV